MNLFGWLSKGRAARRESDSALFSRLDSRFVEPAPGASGAAAASGVSASHFPTSQGWKTAESARFGIRKNLIRMVLRDTLLAAGIPTDWVGAEVLVASSRQRASGIHLRLLIQRWHPNLLPHVMGLQRKFEIRITGMDPAAPEWLTGISWQFALDEAVMPPELPHPSSWTARTRGAVPTGTVPMFRLPEAPAG